MTATEPTPAQLALQAIARCHELTTAMLSAADRGDWDRVADLDRRRRPCFDGARFDDLDQADLESLRERLAAVVAMDGRLGALADAARHSSLAELRAVRRQQRGSARYHELARRG